MRELWAADLDAIARVQPAAEADVQLGQVHDDRTSQDDADSGVSTGVPNDIIFRLSPRGGPPPEAEILFHAQRAQEYGHTWVGLRRGRNADRIHYGKSRLYLITSQAQYRKTVLRGIVREVTATRPDDDLVGDIYRGHDFQAWWRIDNVECLTTEFDALGLRMAKGKAYDMRWLSIRQPFNYLSQASGWPAEVNDLADAVLDEEVCDVYGDIVAPLLTTEEPALGAFQVSNELAPAGDTTIHAVDWSGAGRSADINPKIRYARWDFTNGTSKVTVWPSTLSRSDILEMIGANRGLWILDFPFGLPAELMRRAAAQPNSIDATLAFAQSVEKEEFRDHCNAVWGRVGEHASKHRVTERLVGYGWFSWFVQLFRQTWTGQVEIIGTLRATNPDIAILPWDSNRQAPIKIVEGFPRGSLRHRGLPSTGYKLDTSAGRERRKTIVDRLVRLGLPLGDTVKDEAVNDAQGDLVDALVLLLAGRDALTADHVSIRNELDRRGLLSEGWIYR